MNLHQNIILFTCLNDSTKSLLSNTGIEFKEVTSPENDTYLIVNMIHEDKIRSLLADFDLGSYLRSWSDRYSERVYLKGPVIGMGLLRQSDVKSYDLTDGTNYWKFSKGDL